MGLNYRDLNTRSRKLMADEFAADRDAGRLYLSPRLTDDGCDAYPGLLQHAIERHSDEWLADALRGHFRSHTLRRTRSGYAPAAVPYNASETLAEGQFNLYYVRAICLRAIEERREIVTVYRAKAVNAPRIESEMKIGLDVDAEALLRDLRATLGVEPALGIPAGANSGLSVRLG